MPFFRTLLASLIFASVGIGAELRTLTGKSLTGQLLSATEKEVEFSTATGAVKLPVSQVLDIVIGTGRVFDAATKRIDVELSDGTLLKCKQDGVVFKGTKVELTLFSGQVLKLEQKDISSYLKDAQDAKFQSQWKAIIKRKVKNDRVVVLRDNELNARGGTFGDADSKGESIEFRSTGGGKLSLVLSKIHGMLFHRSDAILVATACQVHDNFGNLLLAQKLSLDASGYKVTTLSGAVLAYDKAGVVRLDYNIDKLNYLSELSPSDVVEKSGSGLVIRFRKDKNLEDGKIRIDGKTFDRGISLHAYTKLEYNLRGKYKEFTAILGVDDSANAESKARVIIECDETQVFSQEISRKNAKPLIIKVKDVNTLRIIVQSTHFLDLHDQVTFANAKVSQ